MLYLIKVIGVVWLVGGIGSFAMYYWKHRKEVNRLKNRLR